MRSAQRHLAPLLARQASTAAVPAKKAVESSGGLFGGLFGGSNRISTPLDEALPDVPAPRPEAPPAQAPQLQNSSLAPGMTLAAVPLPGPTAALSLVLDVGSSHEGPDAVGATAMLRHLAFSATAHRSTFRLTRELEKFGMTASATVDREQMAFTVVAPKTQVAEAAELLLDAALNMRLPAWEVADALPAVQAALAAKLADPTVVLGELLHRAAYSGALSHAALPEPGSLARLSADLLVAFSAQVVAPARGVLAAAGVDASALKDVAGPLVAGPGRSVHHEDPESHYVGGTMNAVAPAGESRFAVAFEVPGGSTDGKTVAAAAVVASLLQARSVLPHVRKEDGLQLTPLSFLYRNTGLLGVAACSAPGAVDAAVDAVARRFEGLAKDVPAVDLQIAKAAAVSAYESSVATRGGLSQAIGRQLLAHGRFDRAEFASKVAALSASDVAGFVSKLLKKPSTFVSYGSLAALPRHDAFAKRLA